MTTRKPKVPEKADDKEQSERFIETAKNLGADKTDKEFKKLFKTVVPQRRGAKRQDK